MENKRNFVYLVFGGKKLSNLMFKVVKSLSNNNNVVISYCDHMDNTTSDTLHMCRTFLCAQNKWPSFKFNDFNIDSFYSDNENAAVIYNVCLQDTCLLQLKSLYNLLPSRLLLYVFVEYCEKYNINVIIEDSFPSALWRFWTNCLVNSYLESHVQVVIRDISKLDSGVMFWKYVAQVLLQEIFSKHISDKSEENSKQMFVFVTETQFQAVAVYESILTFFDELQLGVESSIILISSLLQPKFSCQPLAIITCKDIILNLPPFACKHLILFHSVNCYTEWIQLKNKAKKAEQFTILIHKDEKLELFNRIDDDLRCKMDTLTPGKRSSMKKLRNKIISDLSVLPENLLQINSGLEACNEDSQVDGEDLNTKDKQSTYVYNVFFSDSTTKESGLIGLCVNTPLPFIFPFELLDNYHSNNVEIKYGFHYNMKSNETELTKKFMLFIFCDVLKMTKTAINLNGCSCVLLHLENGVYKIDFNKMNWMIEAQINLCEIKVNFLSQRLFKIDIRNIDAWSNKINEAKLVVNNCSDTIKMTESIQLTEGIANYDHMLEDKDIRMKKLYEKHYNTLFIQVHVSIECFFHLDRVNFKETILASYPFPDFSKAVSYKEYFMKKYNVLVADDELMVPLNYFKPKFNSLSNKVGSKKRTIIYLPLSLLRPVEYISLSLLLHFCLMPSVVFHVKLNLNVFQLHSSINNFSKEKCFHHEENEKNFSLTLSSTADCGLSNKNSVFSENQSGDILQIQKLFLQSIVAANAALDTNNDLLEFLGDSVLKYVITVELYLAFPGDRNSKLVFYRNKILSNKYLSELGFFRHLDEIIIFEIFEPGNAFSLNNPSKIRPILKNCTLNDANERLLANAVEAFIGACFLTLSQESLYNVFKYFGFNIIKLLLLQKKGYSAAYFTLECASFKRMEAFKSLEQKLGYTFKNPTLYFNACLHHSYSDEFYLHGGKNEFDINVAIEIGNNECLELIGDAVLDILVTKEIYERNRLSGANKSGNLSLIRSAIVNTYTFTVFATDLGLHKHLIFSSHKLSQKIIDWLNVYEDMKKTGNLYNKETFNAFVVFHNDQFVEVPKDLANIFEAVAGAVYLDTGGNLDEVWHVFSPFMMSIIDLVYNNIPQSVLQLLSEIRSDVTFKELPPLVNGENACVMSIDEEEFVVTAKSSRVAKSILAVKAFQKLKKSSI